MQEIVIIILVLVCIYSFMAGLLYIYQRKLIYFPVPVDPGFVGEEVVVDNHGIRLHGWVLNPGKPRAVIYFGGNSELVTHRQEFFEDVFRDFSTYLFNYRGYGRSSGSPSESGLFSDALAIYDRLIENHDTIIAYGRSLGSGIAVHLASRRPLEKLVLLTPYDSIAKVAQKIYPIFPVRYLIKDRFDSAAVAGDIRIPVLITSAEYDREIKLSHTLALKQGFINAPVDYQMIAGAAHNDIVDFPDYRAAVRKFIGNKK
ncbi:MAG: alpha/beta hydrolase [Gammaproteobacteria bacterium]|nr:alpha/beta hydrolase [Gammaproteobacteria bacterium]MDH3450429.1 alpha/beta hydrolase [Gammaproteobacteria bacterium]